MHVKDFVMTFVVSRQSRKLFGLSHLESEGRNNGFSAQSAKTALVAFQNWPDRFLFRSPGRPAQDPKNKSVLEPARLVFSDLSPVRVQLGSGSHVLTLKTCKAHLRYVSY